MANLGKQNDVTFTTEQIFGFHLTPPPSTVVPNPITLARTLGSAGGGPFAVYIPTATATGAAATAVGTSQGQGSGTAALPFVPVEDISDEDEEYGYDEEYDEEEDEEEWEPEVKGTAAASLAAEFLQQPLSVPAAKGSAALLEDLEASTEEAEKALKGALLRLRQKYGTARWNEADLEECGRVIYDGPSYNNTISSIVQAKNLLNLYKSALPCTHQPVELADKAVSEVKS